MPFFGPYFGPSGTGGPSIPVLPLSARVALPVIKSRDLPPIAQGSEHQITWTITDANDDPVDLSAAELRVVAYSLENDQYTDSILDDIPTGAFQYDSGDGIEVAGDDNNEVTLTHDAEKTATAGDYRYMLWNVDEKTVLAKGRMPIEPSVFALIAVAVTLFVQVQLVGADGAGGPMPTQGDWFFDAPITVTGNSPELKINGLSPISCTQNGADALIAEYGVLVDPDMTWEVTEQPSGISESVEVPQSGIVSTPP